MMQYLYFIGLGRTAPNPSGKQILDNGVIVPKGTGSNTNTNATSLLYNEYPLVLIAMLTNILCYCTQQAFFFGGGGCLCFILFFSFSE